MKKIALILSLVCLVLASCKDNSIKYNGPDVINMVLRDTVYLNATSDDPLHYKSDNERYVTVSQNGKVFGKNVGSANVIISNTENELTIPVNVSLFEEPTLNFGASTKYIESLYGEPKYNFGDSIYVYGDGNEWYSSSVWKMNFFFDNDKYYESDLYIRNDLDLLLNKYLDENYFYFQALNDTIDGEIKTLHIYFDTEDPRFAEVIVGKQYNAGQYNDILLIYAPASSLNHSKMRDVVSKKRNQQVD